MKPNLRKAAALVAICLLALAWPILPAALALVGWALAHPTLTALGLLAYAYPHYTRRSARRAARVLGVGALLTAQAIRPRPARPATT